MFTIYIDHLVFAKEYLTFSYTLFHISLNQLHKYYYLQFAD